MAPVLKAQADGDREGVHDAGQGRPLLGDLHEHLARATVLVLADGDVALAVGHPEGEGVRVALPGQPLAHRPHHHRVGGGAALLVGQRGLQLGDPLGDGPVGASASEPAGATAPPSTTPSFLVVESGWATLQLSR